MSESTIATSINTNAVKPKKASGDAGSVEQFSLQDQIAAAKFAGSRAVSRKTTVGIKLNQVVLPSSV